MPEDRLGCTRFIGETAVALATDMTFDPTGHEAIDNFEPRPYQIDAWQAVKEMREDGGDKALIHLATGLGKTTVAVLDALRFIEEFNIGRDSEEWEMPKIMFAVHQNEILEQAAERFKSFAPFLEQGYFADGNKDLSRALTFATMQSLSQNIDDIDPDHFDYIIYDEAHHAQADTFSGVVNHFTPGFQLALTATPDRMDGLDIRDLFGKELYKKDLSEALTEGWLADVDYHIRFDDAVKEAMESGFVGSTLKELEALLKNESRNEKIAEQIRAQVIELGLENAKTILFCQTIEHAEEMAELLGGRAYHSDVDKDERGKILRNFRSGGVNLITTRDMFNEGVDIPDARLIVFLRSTGSRTVFEQQLGRGLRKTENKDTVTVLDYVANIERLEHMHELMNSVREKEGINIPDSNEPDGDHKPAHINEAFTLSTSHGDFDFDSLSVELLSKINAVRAGQNLWIDYSDEDIVNLALSTSPDGALTQVRIAELSRSREFPPATLIYTRFGGIANFAVACGFKRPWKGASRQDILEAVQEINPSERLTKSIIEGLASDGLLPSPQAIRTRFGSLDEFNEALGFKNDSLTLETNEDIIAQAIILSPDEPLSYAKIKEFQDQGLFVSKGTIANRFGNLKKFNYACGYKPNENGHFKKVRDQFMHSSDSVIQRAVELNMVRPLQKKDVEELSKAGDFVSYDTVLKFFGGMSGLNQAIEEHRKIKSAK